MTRRPPTTWSRAARPPRSTVTGPSSLTTTTVAHGSSKLYRRPDVCRVPRYGSTDSAGVRRCGSSREPSRTSAPPASKNAAPSTCASTWRIGARSTGCVMRNPGGVGYGSSRRAEPGRRAGGRSCVAPMPRAPRSWMANASRFFSTTSSPSNAAAAVTDEIQSASGGSWRHATPSQRSTPNRPTDAHRTVRVALHDRARRTPRRSTTRSRSEPPAGRSNTAHSSPPSARRISQLDRPSANRRAPAIGVAPIGSPADVELGARRPTSPDRWSVRRSCPTLGMRRSCTCGRSA